MIPRLEAIAIPRLGGGRARQHPDRVLADRAYSCRTNRAWLRKKQDKATIPEPADQIANRKRRGARGGRPPAFDTDRYKDRSGNERTITRLKQHRAVATRYDKLAVRYLATVQIAIVSNWLRDLPNTA